MTEIPASFDDRLAQRIRIALMWFGSFLSMCLLIASLPFWLGPLSSAVVSWLDQVSGRPMFVVLLTAHASLSAAAAGFLVWYIDDDEFNEAVKPINWTIRKAALIVGPFVLLFAVHGLLIMWRPSVDSVALMLSNAGGVPSALVSFSAYSLLVMWYLPLVALAIFVFAVLFNEDD